MIQIRVTQKFLAMLLTSGAVALVFTFQNCSKSHLTTEDTALSSADIQEGNPLVKECVSVTHQKMSAFENGSPSAQSGPLKVPADLELVVLNPQARLLAIVDNVCLEKTPGKHLREMIFDGKSIRGGLTQSAYGLTLDRVYTFQELSQLAEEDVCVLAVDLNSQFEMYQSDASDPRVAEQTHLVEIEQASIYQNLFNSYNGINGLVRVAVIDSGVDIYHPDLKDSLITDSSGKAIGYNGISDTLDFADSGFHGTHVAGLIGATSGNGIGGQGVLGRNLRLIPIKVSTDGSSVDLTAVINGIRWAADQGADVINMSLGGPTDRPTYREALQYAIDKGVFISVAAGNDGKLLGSQVITYPAMYSKDFDGMITIGSIDASSKLRSSFSNYSPGFVELMAPGSNGSLGILSTVPAAQSPSLMASKISKNGSFYPIHGTSMATPVASGAAALAYALARSRGYRPSPAQIKNALLRSAEIRPELTSFVNEGRNLNLQNLVSFIDRDMNISLNSEANRNTTSGKVVIQTHPQDQLALLGGGKVTITVATTGDSANFVNYQWYKNGRPLLGETKKQLILSGITESSAADYHVSIRAGNTEVISSRAQLTVGKRACP